MIKKHKVNRNQEDIDVLKDCVNILEERYMDTDEVEKLITYLTCENSLKENIENVNKYRNEIKRIIPSICDAIDLHDIEELYSIISFILFLLYKVLCVKGLCPFNVKGCLFISVKKKRK